MTIRELTDEITYRALSDLPDGLPMTMRILRENIARQGLPSVDGGIAFLPSRVLLQDFTGVPAVIDLAAMREAVVKEGLPPSLVDARVRADLVIDHSLQVDFFGASDALVRNVALEYERNADRYRFLRWAQREFTGLRVVPPNHGILHQINLERLADVVTVTPQGFAHLDSVVGTDPHTTMINGLGVLGWGVSGIEAEAAMLGLPMHLPTPRIVGVRLDGALEPGVTATDLVLTITSLLRAHDVTGAFVEFHGPGVAGLPLPDRATIANMAPEYGAVTALFPIDDQTLRYLTVTGRPESHIDIVERYCKEQGLWNVQAVYSELITLDLSGVEPSMAGPHRPQDRVAVTKVKQSFTDTYPGRSGDIVIAAITGCTNTSNPSVMVAAGLVAQKAVERGLTVPPWVKTSLAPGSRVVSAYLEAAGLTPYLDKLGFQNVGYGCTTCHGMSGPLAQRLPEETVGVAVLSGNRNLEGRIHPQVRAAYLASPPLVVAYALAGSILADPPLDLLPTNAEISAAMTLTSDMFDNAYRDLYEGDENWRALRVPDNPWEPDSSYLQRPPYLGLEPPGDLIDARVLLKLGDGVTTEHISPAGTIPLDSTAGRYLAGIGVDPERFNTYGTRRGNHEVMTRAMFGNLRVANPYREFVSVYEAAQAFTARGVPLVVVAGKDYGRGVSRDWAAKGLRLLGVRAVLAESYGPAHRSDLALMGVLPLEVKADLDGDEKISFSLDDVTPRGSITLRVTRDGRERSLEALVRLDNRLELDYFRHGGMLPYLLERIRHT